MRLIWRWSLAFGLAARRLPIVDLAFFCANLLKIAEGGWFAKDSGAGLSSSWSTWRLRLYCGMTQLRVSAGLAQIPAEWLQAKIRGYRGRASPHEITPDDSSADD